MDDFGMLARDFGYRPQGKSAPMKSESSRPPLSSATVAGENHLFSQSTNNNSRSTSAMADFDYDAIFKNSNNDEAKSKATTSLNLPVYDDDIFDGLPGLKSSKSMSSSASPGYGDDIFAAMTTSPPKRSQQSDHFDHLMGSLGRPEKVESTSSNRTKSPRGFDDLIPGFGSGNGSGSPAASDRSSSEPIPKSTANTKEASNATDDPFVGLESTSTTANSYHNFSTYPLEEIGSVSKSRVPKTGGSSENGSLFEDIDPLNGFAKSAPAFTNQMNNRGNNKSPSKEGSNTDRAQSSISKDSTQKASFRYSESRSQEGPTDNRQEHQTVFDIPAIPTNHHRSFDRSTSPPSYIETSTQMGTSPTLEPVQRADDIWLSVSEIPLFTQPTRAPPPSRPPPPIPTHILKPERGSLGSNSRNFVNNSSSSPHFAKNSRSPRPFQPVAKSSMSSPVDDLENFAQSGEEMDSILAAASMKEAMDRAEAKFRHAKEVREREHAKAFRNKEFVQPDRNEHGIEEGLRRDKLDRERQQREKEEEEREQRKLEKDRMREVERQKARQAVERDTREARERASDEARSKSERAAVQRAQAEARERAAVGAKERAERATVEAKEKEAQEKAAVARAEEEARRRAERAAVERVAAEARKRAAAEAREKAAASRMNQQKDDNDLESFFSTGSRPSSAPRPRENSSDSAADPLFQNRRGPEGAHRTSSTGVSSNMRKASSTTNIVDDLSSIFGAAPTAAQFQEVVGETEERRRARLEREQRTQERAAKALAEKNQRDIQSQREQEERHRIAGTLDTEIKRWAAGKEGNLRALLSTLQYVLWPECGWQPVSLTDLITGANVKKAYRKATLCIHPDKVQQKGANLQQKYVAEKVFDILKEAWNKFNSEELF